MKKLVIVILVLATLPSWAQFGASLDWLKPGMRWECREFEFLGDYNHPTLMRQAEGMAPGCDKAEIYHNVIYEVFNGPHTDSSVPKSQTIQAIEREARYKMVIALATMRGNRKDDVEIVNQANRYLDKYGDGDAMAFPMHYYLLAAIQRTVRPADRAQEQTLVAVGEHPRQQEFLSRPQIDLVDGEFVITEVKVKNDHPEDSDRFSPKMHRMSYQSLIDLYDGRVGEQNQRLVNQVKGWLNEANEIYADHYIERGDFLLHKNEPFAAAYWYTQLTRRPAITHTDGRLVWDHFDRGSARVARAYLVAAQNFAGVQPSINISNRPFVGAFNGLLWNMNSPWIRRGDMDFSRWLQADRSSNPNDPNYISRAEMAQLAFCSADSVYDAATNGRAANTITEDLAELPGYLAREKAKIEAKVGRINCN